LAALWPGDCQSCGTSFGSDKPSLAVDDLPVFTRATVHHRGCRAPEWNDSLILQTSSSAAVTWRTVVLLLPFQDGLRLIRPAGLLVNPGLEEVSLAEDASGWHPCLDPAFVAAGLTHPTHGIPVGNPAVGVTGHLSQTALSAEITGGRRATPVRQNRKSVRPQPNSMVSCSSSPRPRTHTSSPRTT
jgi:hypothetical protein